MVFPKKKEFYSNYVYQIYRHECAEIEKLMEQPGVHWRVMDYNYWNRFLWYFKACTDEPSQILKIFMEAFQRNRHHFSATFQKMIPYVLKENEYLTSYYKKEYPRIKKLCQEVIDSYNQELIQQIERIGEQDQRYRGLSDTKSFEGIREEEMWQNQIELDLQNYMEIEKIIEIYGYPGLEEVGLKNETIAFLVIQHAGLVAIEKYLPTINKSIANKNIDPSVYPFLYDRMKILKGEPQCFGTQFKSNASNDFYEIIDAQNVNKRRQKYFLPHIELKY